MPPLPEAMSYVTCAALRDRLASSRYAYAQRLSALYEPVLLPVLLVTTKDGATRFCVDYHRLTRLHARTSTPYLVFTKLSTAYRGPSNSHLICGLVLASAHGRCRCSKTAFVTPYRLYEWNVIPFELCNAPATFERMMDNELRGLK